MSLHKVLLEVDSETNDALSFHATALADTGAAVDHSYGVLASLVDLAGIEIDEGFRPVPLLAKETVGTLDRAMFAAAAPVRASASTVVVGAEVELHRMRELDERPDIIVWANPEMYFADCSHHLPAEGAGSYQGSHLFDQASSASGTDCPPYRAAATLDQVRALLSVPSIWDRGFRGQNVIVGILDEGVNGAVYPVVGGWSKNQAIQPGAAHIGSHGSMCAADVLVAAPSARIYDYPFLGNPLAGTALEMFHAVLEQRAVDGTPHLTSNSYAFFGRPPGSAIGHPVNDPDHPLHRKIREVVASGAAVFFAAGNCGGNCPDARCSQNIVGAGSIIASASLEEVITVAAVNRFHERVGYSGQGPGGFHADKPDVAAYSHFYGNYGPGRPAGGGQDDFDSGTSCACPVAAGVGALLLSARPGLSPAALKQALIDSATDLGVPGWDPLTGHGVVNAGAALALLG